MKTVGRGRIQAWPLGTPDSLGDVPFVVDEEGHLRLDRKFKVWSVACPDGRHLTVPITAAVVIWGSRTPRARPAAPAADANTVEQLFSRPAMATKAYPIAGHHCVTCGQWYLRELDAYLCARREDGAAPALRGGDCRRCGYPMELHREVVLEQTGEEEHFEEIRNALGRITERIPHRRATWKATLPAGDAAGCDLTFQRSSGSTVDTCIPVAEGARK